MNFWTKLTKGRVKLHCTRTSSRQYSRGFPSPLHVKVHPIPHGRTPGRSFNLVSRVMGIQSILNEGRDVEPGVPIAEGDRIHADKGSRISIKGMYLIFPEQRNRLPAILSAIFPSTSPFQVSIPKIGRACPHLLPIDAQNDKISKRRGKRSTNIDLGYKTYFQISSKSQHFRRLGIEGPSFVRGRPSI